MPENYNNEENKAETGYGDEDSANKTSLGKSQKIAVAVLAFFAFFTIIIWSYQVKRIIQQPFERNTAKENQEFNAQDLINPAVDDDTALRSKDTDKDGLSDWDELYFYKTSPYLEDSDSDGFTDKSEIDNDKDPNCPSGRDCYDSGLVDGEKSVVTEGGSQDNTSSLNNLLDQLGYEPGLESGGGGESSEFDALFGSDIDAQTLRQGLLEYGMQKEILDQISDEELLQSFNEILGEL